MAETTKEQLSVAEASASKHTSPLHQPVQFGYIFFLEFWERFGFYAMNTLLVIYLTQFFKLDQTASITLVTTFTALNYGFVALGGWLGDKILGTKRVITIGALVLVVAYALITASTVGNLMLLYVGLATNTLGCGLFKSNPSALLTTCYEEGDTRLDGAFTLYYMSVNIGSFFSTMLSPFLAAAVGWNIAFGVTILGMLISVGTFFAGRKHFENHGSPADQLPLNKRALVLVLAGTVAGIVANTILLYYATVAAIIINVVVVLVFIIYLGIAFKQGKHERNKMLVGFVLIVEAIAFFVLYNQMSTSLTLFCVHNVDPRLGFITLQAAQFQSFNPFFIVIFSPLLALFYNKVGDRFPVTYKFAVGMFFTALSFFVLWISTLFLDDAGKISAWWVAASYIFQSLGELLISGLGLSMIAQLVPKSFTGFAMGAWYCASAIASVLGGYVANLITVDSSITDTFVSSGLYGQAFLTIGVVTLIVALIMFLSAGKLKKIADL